MRQSAGGMLLVAATWGMRRPPTFVERAENEFCPASVYVQRTFRRQRSRRTRFDKIAGPFKRADRLRDGVSGEGAGRYHLEKVHCNVSKAGYKRRNTAYVCSSAADEAAFGETRVAKRTRASHASSTEAKCLAPTAARIAAP